MSKDVTKRLDSGVSIRPWARGPRDPQLQPGAVDVWRVDLPSVAEDLLEQLSADEHARAERMVRKRDGELWARSRGVLRALLGSYLHADPGELVIALDARGKPTLGPRNVGGGSDGLPTALCFNLSHSGQTALYAFAADGSVGVDVELARHPINAVAIAARVFGPGEAARLQALDPESRERRFLRAWVRHEARLKCLGAGIGGSGGPTTAPEPWVAMLEIAERAAAAVATSVAPREVRCWDWVGSADSEGDAPARSPVSRSSRRRSA
jgi:4'-phosphopantetheinyl transferase